MHCSPIQRSHQNLVPLEPFIPFFSDCFIRVFSLYIVTNRQHAIHCGALEAFADVIPKAYDDPELIEEYCRSLKYLMQKGMKCKLYL